jgi:uncharacterized protein YdcH (DUF465 family)
MSTPTATVRDQLMVTNEQYQRLREEHTRYATQLDQLAAKTYLSDSEQVEEVRLKKLKLRAKDQMELMVRQAQSVH